MFIGDKIYKTSKAKSSRLNQNELTGASYTWYGWIELIFYIHINTPCYKKKERKETNFYILI